MRKVLIIDDDPDNREILGEILSQYFKVDLAADGETGVRLARAGQPDVILLDLMMPQMDGNEACRILRTNEATRHIPIIVLTGSDDSLTRTRLFSLGADDFIARPFEADELIARICSKIRRIEESVPQTRRLNLGNLTLDLDRIEARIDEEMIPLSVLEFELLKHLIENRHRVLSREVILEAVWRDSVVSGRTVDTHIAILRKKLQKFSHSIGTVYGAGYVIREASV